MRYPAQHSAFGSEDIAFITLSIVTQGSHQFMASVYDNKPLLELTSPLERNLNKAHNYKVDKYTGMESDLKAKGWTVHLLPFKVGSRGHILKHTKNHITSTLKELNFKIKHHN